MLKILNIISLGLFKIIIRKKLIKLVKEAIELSNIKNHRFAFYGGEYRNTLSWHHLELITKILDAKIKIYQQIYKVFIKASAIIQIKTLHRFIFR